MTQIGVYLHIPFCVKKCAYCDFVSYSGKEQKIPAYFAALRQELDWYGQRHFFEDYTPVMLYAGGGTPSLTTAELIRFLQKTEECFAVKNLQERTIEVNPGTITSTRFQQLRQAGFNRVSIGIQSLHNAELAILGRIHGREEAIGCVDAARNAGFENISVDLIFGIPGSGLAHWQHTVEQAMRLHPQHVSLYNLTVEENTPFWDLQQQGKLSLPDEDTQLAMYALGISLLEAAGYEQYEISNFALPGYRSQHNQIYWRNEHYLGLGAGATSYLRGYRYTNTPDLEAYLAGAASIAAGQCQADALYPPTVVAAESLDLAGTPGETIMMNLRLLEGIDLKAFQERFGINLEDEYANTLDKLQALELLEIQENSIRLTSKGILLSNEVFQEFLL